MATCRPPNDPLIVVIGATGTGKSRLAISLASQFNGEVVNADAMQLYDGLPIITNKVLENERQGIPHHLLGAIGLREEPWTVAKFVSESERVIRAIRERGKLPVVVGGTAYYVQALLFKNSLVSDSGKTDDSRVEDIEDETEAKSFEILNAPTTEIYARLQEVDPLIAKRWHPNDRRKIQRSLEIWLRTGRRASEIYEEQARVCSTVKPELDPTAGLQNGTADEIIHPSGIRYPFLIFWIDAKDEKLNERLNYRVEDMVKYGLVNEASALDELKRQLSKENKPPDTTKGIWVSIGYKEFEPLIAATRQAGCDPSELSKVHNECIEATKTATKQYARRQKRWIRIRLANALRQAEVLDKLFLLDGTDLEDWDENVAEPSQTIVDRFLRGNDLPDPSLLSEFPKMGLPKPSDISLPREPFSSRMCEICNKILMSQVEWEAHIASRRHRKTAYAKRMQERQEPANL